MATTVSVVIEGPSDEGAVRAICRSVGLQITETFGRKGRRYIEKNIKNFNEAAKFSAWFVLIDLDKFHKCPGVFRRELLEMAQASLVFRIAVVELEAWLLADREAAADFLGVSKAQITRDPEGLEYPKEYLIGLASRSRFRSIREGLVPREGSGAHVGREYVSMINEYGERRWRPEVAAEATPSLARCLEHLRSLS